MIEPKQIQAQATEQMESAVAYLDDTLAHIRAGKASTRILDAIRVDYYGQQSPLSSVATVTTPDARTIQIQPWDKKMLGTIERAIINASIGLAPNNNGEVIRLVIPPLTEEDFARGTRVGDRFIKMGQRNLAILNAMLDERERALSATPAGE